MLQLYVNSCDALNEAVVVEAFCEAFLEEAGYPFGTACLSEEASCIKLLEDRRRILAEEFKATVLMAGDFGGQDQDKVQAMANAVLEDDDRLDNVQSNARQRLTDQGREDFSDALRDTSVSGGTSSTEPHTPGSPQLLEDGAPLPPDSQPPPPSSPSSGSDMDVALIAGIVVGVVGGVTMLVLGYIYCRRRKGMKNLPSTKEVTSNLSQSSFMTSNSALDTKELSSEHLKKTTQHASMASGVTTGIGLLDMCLGLATMVVNMTRRVVANHARCERLAMRINAMVPLLNALQDYAGGPLDSQQQAEVTLLDPVLGQLRAVLEEAKCVIEKWSQRDQSVLSVVFSMSKSERYGAKFQGLTQSLTECFNDLTLALQLQTRSFAERTVGQARIAKQALDRSKASAEDKEDTKEDLKDLAETLAEHGHSLDKMSKSQRTDLQQQFQMHGLDLAGLLKQERRRTIQEKIRDLKIPWNQIELNEVIGKGGYAKVYRGHWRNFEIAIKEFTQAYLTERSKRVVHHEAYIMSLLRHPNIAVLYGLVDEEDHFALVMEYYGRGSIAHALEEQEQLPWSWKQKVVIDVARGAEYLHSRPYERVVHGDLKPENVMLNDKGDAVITDFGVSRVQSYTNTVAPASSGFSMCYAAPELFLDPAAHREPSSDVYAFGMFVYAVLMQKVPFEGMDPRVLQRLIEDGQRPPIPEEWEKKHVEWADLIRVCWSQDPHKRPTFAQISARLERIQVG